MSRTTISYNSNGFIIISLSVAHDWAQESLALTKQQIMRQRLWLRGVRQRPECMLLPASCTPHCHIAELCAHTRQRKLFLFWGAELKRYLIVNYQKSYLGLSCNVRAGRKLNLSWRRQSYPHQRASRTVPF